MLADEVAVRLFRAEDNLVIIQDGMTEAMTRFTNLLRKNRAEIMVFGIGIDNPFLSGGSTR